MPSIYLYSAYLSQVPKLYQLLNFLVLSALCPIRPTAGLLH